MIKCQILQAQIRLAPNIFPLWAILYKLMIIPNIYTMTRPLPLDKTQEYSLDQVLRACVELLLFFVMKSKHDSSIKCFTPLSNLTSSCLSTHHGYK